MRQLQSALLQGLFERTHIWYVYRPFPDAQVGIYRDVYMLVYIIIYIMASIQFHCERL